MRPINTRTVADGIDPIEKAVSDARTSRMTEHEISYMLAAAARIPEVYRVAGTRLTPDLFEPGEAQYTLFWRSVTAGADSAGGLLPADPAVAKEHVALHVSKEVATDTTGRLYSATVEASVLDPGGLLDEAYALPLSSDVITSAFDLLARFIHERKLFDPVRRALAGITHRQTLKDPQTLFALFEGHARDMAGLGADPGEQAIVEEIDFVPESPVLFTTGQRWLDEQLGGGAATKEAYVVLAGTGAGKSALCAQIAVDGAELQASLVPEIGSRDAGHWYIFTWELTNAQLRERVYAYGARVSRNTFRDADPHTRRPIFSTSEDMSTLKAYEHEPFVNSPGNPVRGERERIAAFRRRMTKDGGRLQLIDFSGRVPGCGTGGVPEVVRYLRTEQAKGRRVAGVVIDYAGLVVQRHIAASGLRPESEYNLLASFVDQVRSQIAVPLDCTVWVPHQLHGDSTRRSPGAKIHHSEARGCRNFADNSDFAFCLSPYNKANGLLTVNCTKHRRAPGMEDGAIVHFDGRFGAFRDPDQAYAVDPMTRQIVPRAFLGGGGGILTSGGVISAPTNGPPPVDPRTIF